MPTTATGARGERTFKAGAREVTLLFTNRALAGAEKRLGRGILELFREVQEKQAISIGDMTILLQTGMEAARIDSKAGGRTVTLDDAFKVLDAIGLTNAISPVVEAIAAVIAYSGEPGDTGEGDSPNA